MWISPDGYGSISSTYAFGRAGSAGRSPSRESGSAWKARSRSQTPCHLDSTGAGSYRSGSIRAGADTPASIAHPPWTTR